MLESLEQEYRREEDWCGGGDRQPEQLLPLINKHMEQKEAFLKVRRKGGAWLRPEPPFHRGGFHVIKLKIKFLFLKLLLTHRIS